MAKPVFEASFVSAQNTLWSQKSSKIMNQILFLHEVHAITSDFYFNAESVHFTDDPTSYADAMYSTDLEHLERRMALKLQEHLQEIPQHRQMRQSQIFLEVGAAGSLGRKPLKSL